MFMVSKLLTIACLTICLSPSYAEESFQPLGNAADEQSRASQWNLSISPTGKGLPQGQGTAAQGAKLFAIQCAGCHGPEGIGASAEPLMGEVGSLSSKYPEKTVNSYWPYATTLFDYIRRAMPINAPFSLSADEVYALCAYILSKDGIVSPETVLNEHSLPQIKMPNRDGFIAIHPDNR